MIAVMASIKPRHNKNILNYIKWWEIRKMFPLDYVGWVYIYNTKDTEHGYLTNAYVGGKLEFITSFSKHEKYRGKVIARFWCDRVEEIEFDLGEKEWFTESCPEEKALLKESCLQDYELDVYLGGKNGRAVHIQKVEIFNTPKSLSEFNLVRAPQSWCYIEV